MLKGKDGVIYVGTPKVQLGHIQSWNIDLQADQVSGWGMGDEYETSFTTVKRWSGSFEAYLDFSQAFAAISVGDELDVELYPGGESIGSGFFSGRVAVTGLPMSGSKDGIPLVTINFASRGDLTTGEVS